MLGLAGLVGFVLADPASVVEPLALALAICAIAAELTAARYSSALTVSAAFVAAMLAVGFLGPSAAVR